MFGFRIIFLQRLKLWTGMQLWFSKSPSEKHTQKYSEHGPGPESASKFGFSSLTFLQWLKLATSLVHSLGLPGPIIRSHPKEKVDIALVSGPLSKFGVIFNIFAMAESSDFKFRA